MAILKKYMLTIILALVCLSSLGAAGWAYTAGDDIVQRVQKIHTLQGDLRSQRGNAQNLATIAARKSHVEAKKTKLARSLEVAMAKQTNNAFEAGPRQLLLPDVLPEPANNSMRFDFKAEYEQAFNRMIARLHARGRAALQEILAEQAVLDSKKQGEGSGSDDIWRRSSSTVQEEEESDTALTRQEVLNQYASARAAENVARSLYLYMDRNAIRAHSMIRRDTVPSTTAIWHAQMGLWIQQDIVTALAQVNEERAAELRSAGREEDIWVAHMPIKRLRVLRIRGWLGRGGGSNSGRFAKSFTRVKNDQTKFLVPLQLDMVIEDTALLRVVESLCRVGFYTPTRIQYRAVDPIPLQDTYIYGEDPVIRVTIDLEGYYLRKVFEDWIPKDLRDILATPEAQEKLPGR